MSITKIREKALNSIIVPVAVGIIGITMIVGIFVSFSPSSKQQNQSPNTVKQAFAVDGLKVNDQFLIAQMNEAQNNASSQGQPFGPSQEAQYKGELVDQMVQQAIVAAAADKAGISVPRGEVDKFLDERYQDRVKAFKQAIFRADAAKKSDDELDQQLRKGSQEKLSLEVVRAEIEQMFPRDFVETMLLYRQYRESIEKKISVSDAALLDSYRAVTTRHILINNTSRPDAQAQKRAQEVLTKLKGGADFAALAKQYSDDPGSKDKGGLYAAQTRATSQFVKEYMDAALALQKPGDITQEPVKTQFGYHVIKLEKSEMQLPKDFDKKKSDYRKTLQQTLAQQAWQTETTRLQKNAKIAFENPAYEGFYYWKKASMGDAMSVNGRKAETAFKRALQDNPNDASLYVVLAQAQGMMGKPKDAIATLKMGLDGNKFEDAQSRLALAGMLMTSGKKQEAFEQYKKASDYTIEPQVHMQLLQVFTTQFKNAKLAAYSQSVVDRYQQQMKIQQEAMQRKMMEEAKQKQGKAAAGAKAPTKPAQGDNPANTQPKEPR